jgi:hypothetical protein
VLAAVLANGKESSGLIHAEAASSSAIASESIRHSQCVRRACGGPRDRLGHWRLCHDLVAGRLDDGSGGMFDRGWMRLWLVATAVLLGGVAIAAAYYVRGVDACYRFVSVSVAADKASQADQQLVDSVKNDATTKVFCGTTEWSTVLTLEGLAQRGVVTQVGFQMAGT